MGFSESKVHSEEKEEKTEKTEGEAERGEKKVPSTVPTISQDDILALQKQTNFQAVEVSHSLFLDISPSLDLSVDLPPLSTSLPLSDWTLSEGSTIIRHILRSCA
jgi:hypothetical protein